MKKQTFNPYLPSYEYIPDAEPRIFGQRLYIYGSHDKFGSSKYCENDYVCWSTPLDDLSDWRYEGTIYTRQDHPVDEIHKRTCLYAPDVVQGTDGNYYLYYSMSGSSIISVAVSDSPAGHYTYLGDVHYPDSRTNHHTAPAGYTKGEFYQFDPSVLIDDDGKVYLYSGFAPKADEDEKGRLYAGCHAYELASDMLTIIQGPSLIIPKNWKKKEGASYFEAPSMRKINEYYYLVYSARITGLFYYYSKNPLKDFQFGGRIHSTSDIGINGHDADYPAYPVGNIHGGLVCINNQYYIFDHRHTNHTSYQRQGVAEPVYFEKDGSISQAEATSCGLNGLPLLGEGTYPAYIACSLFYPKGTPSEYATACMSQDSEDIYCKSILNTGSDYHNIECVTKPVQYLQGINNNLTFGYKYFTVSHRITEIQCKIRGTAHGIFGISLGENTPYVGEIHLCNSSSDWTMITIPCNIPVGKQALFFTYHGEGAFDMLFFTLHSYSDWD